MQKFIVSILLSIYLFPALCQARGGGGHSFSGGHSSGSFSGGSHSFSGGNYGGGYAGGGYYGGGGSGSLLFLILLVIIAVIVISKLSGSKNMISSMSEINHGETNEAFGGDAHGENLRAQLARITENDENFSYPLFQDFSYALFSTLHHARGLGSTELMKYYGYVSELAAQSLLHLHSDLVGVEGVVIGGYQLASVNVDAETTTVNVHFDANYTEETAQGKPQSYYVQEVWSFQRKNGVKSRPPEKAKQIQCPNCGAAPQSDAHGVCRACGQSVRNGVYDWFVSNILVQERSSRPPLLSTTVEEEGNDLPTVVDRASISSLASAGIDSEAMTYVQTRAAFIFNTLQSAWSKRDLTPLRGLETDTLYENHLYWISEYKKQHLINRLEDVKIDHMELSRFLEDHYYHSLTLRIFAEVKDWTETESGEKVCGSKVFPRAFTEYWTFIRSKDFKAKKEGAKDTDCPACGAPLQVNQFGECEYCKSKITSGNFDWVLSTIEQDESYS